MANDRGTIVVEWRRRVRTGWGLGAHWHAIDSTAALVRALVDGRAEPEEVLGELGRRCGVDGHPLDQTIAWTAELIDVLPRRLRRKVDQRQAAIALAAGWADGALERAHARGNGVSSMAALQLELRRIYEQCAALGTNPVTIYAIVVFDIDSGLLPPAARAAAVAAMAAHAARTFAAGETVAATATGRLLILAERAGDLHAAVRAAVVAAEASPLLAGCGRVQGWVEPLAPDPTHVDAHLAELAG
jgi:hypothetical protein